MLRVNLGCGTKLMPGAVNVDIVPPMIPRSTISEFVLSDIRNWRPSQKANQVLAIHVVEHLPKVDVREFLLHVGSYLDEDGTLIIEMPDREKCLALTATPDDWRIGILGLVGDRSGGGPELFSEWIGWRNDHRIEIVQAANKTDFESLNIMIPQRFRLTGQAHEYVWSGAEFASELEAAGFRNVEVTEPLFHGRRSHRDTRWIARK